MSLQERHVRARIRKRQLRCTSVPSTADLDPSKPCPGWVVQLSSRGSAMLMACPNCNALSPVALRVTDADVRQLPEARSRQLAVDAEERERRRRARFTVHLEEFTVGQGIRPDSYTIACGHKVGRTPGGRRVHQATSRQRLDLVTCEECLRLAAMTPEQREEERAAKSAKIASNEKISAEKKAADEARSAQRETMKAEVAAVRPSAIAAWDILQLHPGWDTEADAGTWPEDHQRVVSDVLCAAMLDYKVNNWRTSGSNHWVSTRPAPGAKQFSRSGRLIDVTCRYCRAVLIAGQPAGVDYTREPVVRRHTVLCAIAYLDPSLEDMITPEIG